MASDSPSSTVIWTSLDPIAQCHIYANVAPTP